MPLPSKYKVLGAVNDMLYCGEAVEAFGAARRSAATEGKISLVSVCDAESRVVCDAIGSNPTIASIENATIPIANVTSISENARVIRREGVISGKPSHWRLCPGIESRIGCRLLYRLRHHAW